LCISLIRSVHGPIDTIFKAKGELKYYQISEGIILAMPLVLGYIVLKFGAPYASVFVCCIAMELVNLFVMLILAHKIAGFNSRSYARHILLPSFLCIVCAGGMFYIVRQLQPIWIQVLISVISMGICSGLWWWIILTKEERTNILSLLPNYHVHDSQR
jgi:hypothetical protein